MNIWRLIQHIVVVFTISNFKVKDALVEHYKSIRSIPFWHVNYTLIYLIGVGKMIR